MVLYFIQDHLLLYDAEIANSDLTTNGKYGYKNTINNIHNNPFSEIKLSDLTIEAIQQYVDGLYFGFYDEDSNQIAKPYAKATMRKFFLILNNMFKQFTLRNFLEKI